MNDIVEVKIKFTPQTAFEYIKNNKKIDIDIETRNKLEQIIAQDAEFSFFYARDVLKTPFPAGEAAIAKDAGWAYYYAKDVLSAPFPAGEAAIANSEYKEEYEEYFNIKL